MRLVWWVAQELGSPRVQHLLSQHYYEQLLAGRSDEEAMGDVEQRREAAATKRQRSFHFLRPGLLPVDVPPRQRAPKAMPRPKARGRLLAALQEHGLQRDPDALCQDCWVL